MEIPDKRLGALEMVPLTIYGSGTIDGTQRSPIKDLQDCSPLEVPEKDLYLASVHLLIAS